MSKINYLIAIQLHLKRYKLPFVILFLFWCLGFIFFLITEPFQDFWHLFLLSWTIRFPATGSDFANFYKLIWPILLEVVVFGFIIGELLERYNPVITSRTLAQHKRNHTVIIGFEQTNQKIVNYCIENKESFVIIEEVQDLVGDLINSRYPIVVGDATDIINLNFANVKEAKEVFISVDDVRVSIVCIEKIRKINPKCPIYVHIFENHIQEYVKGAYVNVFAYSISNWAMDAINEWIKTKTGKAIVIGRDYLTHQLAYSISLQPEREVYVFDDEHDGIEFMENEQIHIINELACFLSDIRPHVNLEEITQAFLFWKRTSEFDEALYLTSKLHLRYPHIEVFVRIFDDELVDLVKRCNAQTISTSSLAFNLLQKNVSRNSAIALK